MKIMLDTINLTFVDFFDFEKVSKSFKELPTYEYFEKIQKLFDYFGWDKKDFILKKLSQNFYKLYDDMYYVEIKNYSANGEKSNPEKKLVMIQLKGHYFLEKGYQELQKILIELKDLGFKISKIEVAVDTQDEYVFETMLKSLKYRKDFIKLSGKITQYFLNFNDKQYESLTLQNSVMLLKVYNKRVEIELERNKNKMGMYYQKTNFKKSEDITRLELSLKRSSSINQDYLNQIINNDEEIFNKILLKDILSKIEILRNSQIKKVINNLKIFSKRY